MQPTTPHTAMLGTPDAPSTRPGCPQALTPLPPHVQQHSQLTTQGSLPSLSARHISDQTWSINGAVPTLDPAPVCTIAGYTLERTGILRPDGRKLDGLGRSHATLATYLNERRGQPITQTQLQQIAGFRNEVTVGAYMTVLPPAFNIKRTNNAQGIACWIMNEPSANSSTAISPAPTPTQWRSRNEEPVSREDAEILPMPLHPISRTSTCSALEETEILADKVRKIVNDAAENIRGALTNRRWAQMNQHIRALSDGIAKFLSLHDAEDLGTMRSPVSVPALLLFTTLSAHKDPIVRSHMKAGCHHFGLHRYPLPLLRLLRCRPLKKSTIEVVESHKTELLSPTERARALQAVLIYLSWLEPSWDTSSEATTTKQSTAIDEDIQRLFDLLNDVYKNQESDAERAAVVSDLKEALAPEHCSSALALKLNKAQRAPRWVKPALKAAIRELNSHAVKHPGPVSNSHPFEVHAIQLDNGAKRKREGAGGEHVSKKARTSFSAAPTDTHTTASHGHPGPPSVTTGVSVAALLGIGLPMHAGLSPLPGHSSSQTQQFQPYSNGYTHHTSAQLSGGDFSAGPVSEGIEGSASTFSNTNTVTDTDTNAEEQTLAASQNADEVDHEAQNELDDLWTDMYLGYDNW